MTRYSIEVQGPLPAAAVDEFASMFVTSACGVTTLTGDLADSAALYGLIARLESLGLVLAQIRSDPPESGHSEGRQA